MGEIDTNRLIEKKYIYIKGERERDKQANK